MVAEVIRSLTQSPLKGCRMLITGGPTPVPLDRIRRITTKFSGGLSIEISREAWFRGAEVKLILGRGSLQPPSYLDSLEIADFHQYRKSSWIRLRNIKQNGESSLRRLPTTNLKKFMKANGKAWIRKNIETGADF